MNICFWLGVTWLATFCHRGAGCCLIEWPEAAFMPIAKKMNVIIVKYKTISNHFTHIILYNDDSVISVLWTTVADPCSCVLRLADRQ